MNLPRVPSSLFHHQSQIGGKRSLVKRCRPRTSPSPLFSLSTKSISTRFEQNTYVILCERAPREHPQIGLCFNVLISSRNILEMHIQTIHCGPDINIFQVSHVLRPGPDSAKWCASQHHSPPQHRCPPRSRPKRLALETLHFYHPVGNCFDLFTSTTT